MGYGFRKSFKIAPGVRVNVGKKSVGVSAGVKGLRYSVNSRTGSRVTASIPGTGLSYTTSGGRSRKSSAYQRQADINRRQREIDKLNELEQARLAVEAYENTIERIHSIHIEADEPVNWIKVRGSDAPYHLPNGEMGEKEKLALQKLQNYKPGVLSRLFNRQSAEQKLQEEVIAVREEDKQDYLAWERDIKIATKVLEGDIDTYFQVIDAFAPLDDLTEFGSGFEFSCGDPKVMEIEFEVNAEDVVPKEQLSLTKTGKLSRKQMPKGKFYDIQQDYVCSCILRIARDMFALLPLHTVYIHAIDNRLNTATGYMEKITILSVKLDKGKLNRLNFANIDCSDALENFEHKMNFKKTKGFEAVSRLMVD
ncbi:DUF4236 domain-containing protein [Niallia sp. Sow4_A1]|uniref:DUF4236 domain-containing protein n=1 Tax=Niallia hominis TaxID=3133173 RepID=A0ABV1EZB5_9BACI|nr:DUF4236 domain-containing protein [Bacillus sp. MB2021]